MTRRPDPLERATRKAPLATLGREIVRFGLVGGVATLVHALIAMVAVGLAPGWPFAATLLGFAGAFSVSLLGHARITFRRRARPLRFLITTLSGLATNLLVLRATLLLGLDERYAILAGILSAPVVVFVMSKFWAFGENRSQGQA